MDRGGPIICKVRLKDFQSIAILLEDYIHTCGNSRFTELFFISLFFFFKFSSSSEKEKHSIIKP